MSHLPIDAEGCITHFGKRYRVVTLDFETYYGRGYSLSLQRYNTFKYIADEQFKIHGVGIKIGREPTNYFYEKTEVEHQILTLHAQVGMPIALLCHNTAFDALVLHYCFGWHPALYLDTLSMSRGLFVGWPANLDALTKRLFPNDRTKRKGKELESFNNVRDLTDEQQQVMGSYCRNDCELTFDSFCAMFPYYPEDELELIHKTIRFNANPMMELDFKLLDEEIAHREHDDKRIQREAQIRYQVTQKTLSSNDQFVEVLRKLEIPVPTKLNAKGAKIPALGQKDWDFQKLQAAHPEHAVLWEARRNAKSNIQLSRAQWVKAVGKWWDGLLPVPLNYYGADTGRWSGGEKLNLQNLPRIAKADETSGRLRKAIRAPKGYVIVVRDLSNIEGRVLATLAGQWDKVARFARNECTYLHLASEIYEIPFESMSKETHGGERNVGKVGDLGLGYGLGTDNFWIQLNTGPMGMPPIVCDWDFAFKIRKAFHTLNDKIIAFWKTCDGFIDRMYTGSTDTFGPLEIGQNHIMLPNGMALQYPGLTAFETRFGHEFKFGINGPHKKIYGAHLTENIVQALARVIIGEQMIEVDKRLNENYGNDIAALTHMVHDEMLAVVPESEAEDVYNMMGEVMSKSPIWMPDLPLMSEGGYARNYIK